MLGGGETFLAWATLPFRSDVVAGAVDAAFWVKRVLRNGVDHVMCFSPAAVEASWMDAHPRRFARLAGDATWGLFEVRRPLAVSPSRGGGNPTSGTEAVFAPGPAVRLGVGEGATK